jgi:hypothetical protein
MLMTLEEYNDLPVLDSYVRQKMHDKLVNTLLDNPELLRSDLEEIVDYFVTELGNADFIRMCDTIKEKVKRG